MKPRIIVTNKEIFDNLCLLKHFNTVSISNTKKNLYILNRIIKNINRSKQNIFITETKDKIFIKKKNSNLDFLIYLK